MTKNTISIIIIITIICVLVTIPILNYRKVEQAETPEINNLNIQSSIKFQSKNVYIDEQELMELIEKEINEEIVSYILQDNDLYITTNFNKYHYQIELYNLI